MNMLPCRSCRFALALLAILALAACSSGYRVDFPPPSGRETYAEVLPGSIGGAALAVTPMQVDSERYRGARAEYGDAASIEILQTRSDGDIDAYVDAAVKQRLQRYKTRMSGKFNGVWELRAHGAEGRLYAWQNQRWLFVIEARSDELFDEVVDKFAYIAK